MVSFNLNAKKMQQEHSHPQIGVQLENSFKSNNLIVCVSKWVSLQSTPTTVYVFDNVQTLVLDNLKPFEGYV